MPLCELCGLNTNRIKRSVVEGMGSMELCEECRASLNSASPGQRPSIVRARAILRQRSLTK